MTDRCQDCLSNNYDFVATRQARERFKPEKVRVLFVAEAPTSRMIRGQYLYFYFLGIPAKTHWLYRYTMEAIYGPVDLSRPKGEYLRRFCNDGYYLLDAARCPVNNDSNKARNEAIKSCSSLYLLPEIRELQPAAILLIKANVFRILRESLSKGGYRILNDGPIPFPSTGHQREYVDGVRQLLQNSRGQSRG